MSLLKKVTSAVAGLAIVFSIVSPIAGVSAAYTSLEAANKLATLGVIVDQSSNPSDYRLGDTITRREMLKVMAGLSGVSVSDTCTGEFADLSSSDWGCKYAEAALANGMIAANTNFRPDDNVSKIEGLKMVFTARGLERNDSSDWRMGYVEAAVEMGVAASAFTDYDMSANRGQIFVWAVNAVDADDASSEEDDLLGSLLGSLGDDTTDTSTTTDTTVTTPVVTTGGELMVSLSPLSPDSTWYAANRARTQILAFDVTAGATDVTLDEATFSYTGLSSDDDITDVAMYIGAEEVSKSSRDFSSNEARVSFDNDVVVQAGQTATVYVTATLAGGVNNVSHRITLDDLEASESVSLGDVESSMFNVVLVSDDAAGSLELDVSNINENEVVIGADVMVAEFTLSEEDDVENVNVESMIFSLDGDIDFEDEVSNIMLTANGTEVASGLMVNSDDEISVSLDVVVPADEEVEFVLTLSFNELTTNDVTVTLDEVFATGASTGVNASIDPATELVATISSVIGSEINATFDASDVDEAKADSDEVAIGTLTLETEGDYEVDVTVEVMSNSTVLSDVIDRMELDGKSSDEENDSATTGTYVFEDVSINGETVVLPLTVDIEEDALNNTELDFKVTITAVEDVANDEDYTGSAAVTAEVLNKDTFSSTDLTIEDGSLELVQTRVNDRELILNDGEETVLFKGEIDTGDSDDVELESIIFTDNGSALVGSDLQDVIARATLYIGGQSFTDTPDSSGELDFNVNLEIPAGSDDVEVVLYAELNDDGDDVTGTMAYTTSVAGMEVVDSNNDTIVPTLSLKAAQGNDKDTITTIRTNGTLEIDIDNNTDYDDMIEAAVLAGSSDVYLAGLNVHAEYEAMDVTDLTFTANLDISENFENVRLMDGSTVVASGGDVDGMTIVFEDVTFADSTDEVELALVADAVSISDAGDADAVSALLNLTLTVAIAAGDVEGADSDDDITGADLVVGATVSEAVSVVPALVTVTIDDSFGASDAVGEIVFNVDMGNNVLEESDVLLATFPTADFANVYDDDLVAFAANVEIKDGDVFKLEALATGLQVLDVDAITVTIDGATYGISNDKNMDLGTYSD